jgi:hypothetical protein
MSTKKIIESSIKKNLIDMKEQTQKIMAEKCAAVLAEKKETMASKLFK